MTDDLHCQSESVHQPHWWKADPTDRGRYQCPGTAEAEMTPENMRHLGTFNPATDPVIPPEAVEAGAKAIYAHGVGNLEVWAQEFQAVQDELRSDVRVALQAALPHLRPLFEVATQVGLELGRQEAAEEIAVAFDREVELIMSLPDDEGVRPQVRDILRARRAAFRDSAHMAREVATRTADARTDPSGHTDLPPTPDAVSKRLPEEGDEWCCGTCQRIAWEANPMSREEQSAGETP